MRLAKSVQYEIDQLLNQRMKNDQFGRLEENKLKKLLRDINVKIQKANLKTTYQKLINAREEIRNNFKASEFIGYKCDKHIQCRLYR